MADRPNEAWRAYALMIWPHLSTFGNEQKVLDEEGNPVLDDDGKPKTKWVGFNINDMIDRTIITADALYAAEMAAERRRADAEDKPDG